MKQIFVFFSILLISVSGFAAEEKTKVTIAAYNAQTFFDSVTDGCEYKQFITSTRWNRDEYEKRLKRLCNVIKELNADIIVLEEIENAAILQDIANQFAGASWKTINLWNCTSFSKTPGDAIGIAILSRFPITSVKTHSLKILTQSSKQPSMRPIVEAEIQIGEKKLFLYANHWKSKSGGAEKSEIWRDWQESVLARLLIEKSNDKNFAAVMCGDFNRDIHEFIISKNDKTGNVIFRNAGFGKTNTVKVSSPWIDTKNNFTTETGSYYFDNEWERIDHFFYMGKIDLEIFSPLIDERWCKNDSTPRSYIFSGTGYSDHLPILASFYMEGE